MILTFDPHGNQKQHKVCQLWADHVTTDIVYGGSKGSGKSFLGCSLIFSDALTYPNTLYFIARKKLNDLRKHTMHTISEVLKIWGLDDRYYSYNGKDDYYQLYNESRVYLIEAKYLPTDPLYQRFGSMQYTRGMIEEAGEIDEEAKNNLVATIGRWKNDVYHLAPKLIQTCNPSKNYLYKNYYKKYHDGTLEPWKAFIQALPTDNKMLPKDYITNLERNLSPNQKQRLLFGNWEFDDDPDLLVDYDAVCDAFTNEVSTSGLPAMSADLAMKGRDKFIGGVWYGEMVNVEIDIPYNDAKEAERILARKAQERQIARSRIVADSDGLGAYLSSYLTGIKEFHGGHPAINTAQFANIKTECAYKLAEKINARRIRINCSPEQEEHIKEELMLLKAIAADADVTKKRLISKDEMKVLLGHSPDYLDMLIMKQLLDLIPPARGIRRVSMERPPRRR